MNDLTLELSPRRESEPIGWHLEKCPCCYGRGCFTSEPTICHACDGSGILAVAADGTVKKVSL